MGFTQWLIVHHPDLTFGFVSEARYVRFWNGHGTLPQVRPGEVRAVEVSLRLEQRTAREIVHIAHRRFPALESGHRDDAFRQMELSLIGDIMALGPLTAAESARRLWARHQVERTFRWTPTTAESREIADLVSRRAKRSP